MKSHHNKIEYNKFEKINLYLTGYGPFGTIKENPAEKVSTFLFEHKDELKTKFTSILYNQIFEVTTGNVDQNISKIFNFIEKNNTDKKSLHIIISFGVAQNRLVNTIETLGQNYIYDLIKDQKIDDNKPEKFYSKTPVKSIVKGIQKFEEIECKFSNDAGTYLCNYIYYHTLAKYLNEENVCSFFIHVPELKNYNLDKHEKFFRNFISVLEDLYIIGNDEKRNKILSYAIIDEEDEHIDEWNKKKKDKKEEKKDEEKKNDENKEEKKDEELNIEGLKIEENKEEKTKNEDK